MGFGSMVNYLLCSPIISLLLHQTQDIRYHQTTDVSFKIAFQILALVLPIVFVFNKKLRKYFLVVEINPSSS